MAQLAITEQFEAVHGSFEVRTDTYTVTVCVQGPIENGFVQGLDSSSLRKYLVTSTTSLKGKYLDDIVGRGTDENIALYLLHHMKEVPALSSLTISGADHGVTVYPSDINHESYPARLLYERARSLLYRDKVDDAIDVVTQAIQLDDTFPPAFNLRGRCNRKKEKWDLALPDFERALELDRGFGEAYRNRGNALYHLGRVEEIIEAFTCAAKLMPNSALAVNNRGFAYQRLEKWELALVDHTKAIELDPNYAEAHSDKAVVLRKLGKTEKAKEHEQIAEELRSTGTDTYEKKIFY